MRWYTLGDLYSFIPQHDEDTSAFRSQGVLYRDFDVLKRNVRCARCRRVGRLDGFRLNTLSSLDKNDGEAVFGLAANGETTPRYKHRRTLYNK